MSHDFFKKLLVVIEGADNKKDSCSTLQKKLANESKVTESTARASNTKDSALDFFRKYSDIISEAEQTDKSDKKWYVDSKSGDRKAGPFDSEVEASDHLAKLKKNNTEEDTKGFELVNESVAIKKSGKKVNEAVRAVVKTSTGQFARPDGQDQRDHVAGMIKGNRAANRDTARKLQPDDRRGSSSATHPESNDGSRGAFQGGAGTAHAVKESMFISAGGSVAEMLTLNLFSDFFGEESVNKTCPGFSRDFGWREVGAKYKPIAADLAKKIKAEAKRGRKLTQQEADVLDNIEYDGPDGYDDIDLAVEEMPDTYDQQIKVINAILSKTLSQSGLDIDLTESRQMFVILDKTLIPKISAMDGTGVDEDQQTVESDNPNVTAKLMAFATKNPTRLKVSHSLSDIEGNARPAGNQWSKDQSPALESFSGPSDEVTADDIEELFNSEYESNVQVAYAAFIRSSAKGQVYFFVSQDDETGKYLVNSITIADDSGALRMVDHGGMPEDEFDELEDAVAYINANGSTQQTPVAESTRIWVKNK